MDAVIAGGWGEPHSFCVQALRISATSNRRFKVEWNRKSVFPLEGWLEVVRLGIHLCFERVSKWRESLRHFETRKAEGKCMRQFCFVLLYCVPSLLFAQPKEIARPDFFKTLVNPPCSHCVDEAKRRAQDLKPDDRILAWIRGNYDGGAIPYRFFLVPYRVISDTYGVFVYDADAGFVRGFEPSLDFTFHGWRNGIMTIRHKDGTVFSALTGIASDGPRKGERLKAVPTLETDWGYWLKAYPGTVAYHMFDKYVPFELPQAETPDAIATRPDPDPRLGKDQFVIGVELNGQAKAYPISILSTNHVIRDRVGESEVVALWYGATRTAAVYAPRMENETIPERLKLEPNPQIPTAPFMDRETYSHWTIEGRAVEGPLKGKTLQWLPGVQCKWWAWAAEYPHTSIYQPSERVTDEKLPAPVAKLIQGERLDWDKLAKTYARVVRIDPAVRRIVLWSESDAKERIVRWSAQTEFYTHGAWGNAADFSTDQRVYVLATTGPDKEWQMIHALADEMSMQAMAKPYVLKQFDKENGRIVLVDETGNRPPVDLSFDSKSVFVTASPSSLPMGQASYCNTKVNGESRVVMELLDAPSFASEQQRRTKEYWDMAATNGLTASVLSLDPTTNRMTVLVRRADAWVARTIQLQDKIRIQRVIGDDTARRSVIYDVRPDYSRTRVVLEIPANVQFAVGDDLRLLVKVPKTLDPIRPPDLGRFTGKQDRIDYFLSTLYCTCGMMGNACAGHWNTLAACKIHGCGLPDLMTQIIGASIDAGKTDQQILDLLLQREGELVLRQHHYH